MSPGTDASVAARANVAVGVAAPNGEEFPDAAILFRQPDLEKCVLLRLMGLASVEHQKGGRNTALAANLACVFGALFLQFPALAVVGLTNFGTFASYLRHASLVRGRADESVLNARVTIPTHDISAFAVGTR